MNSNSFYLRLAVIAVAYISVGMSTENDVGYKETTLELNRNETKQLLFLGNADGKSFFADYVWSGNWTSAREYCASSGMHLATITSSEQWGLLVAARNTTTFYGDFWTSLRDAHVSRQFSWDTLETEPVNGIGLIWANPHVVTGDYQTCACYNTAGHLRIDFCSSGRHVLCET